MQCGFINVTAIIATTRHDSMRTMNLNHYPDPYYQLALVLFSPAFDQFICSQHQNKIKQNFKETQYHTNKQILQSYNILII